MATVTLTYNARSFQAKKLLEYALSVGIFSYATTEKKAMSSIEKSFADIENGKVHRLITPKNYGK